MKALEKDRGRRYESASGFAADIHRYLNNEPVSARPPSLQYRMQKFVRKNRVGVAASLLVLLALLAGITGTSLALYRALQAEELAEVRLADADRARDAEFRQRQLAEQRQLEAEREKQIAQDAARRELEARIAEEKQRNFAEAINRFVRDDFLALTSVEGRARFGGEGLDRHSTLTELLQRAARKLQARSDLAPEIEAELAWMIGVNLRANGEAQQATSFLERAVQLLGETQGSDAEITWDARGSLAVAHLEAGNFDQAIQLHDLQPAVRLGRRVAETGPSRTGRSNDRRRLPRLAGATR
jgi:hypothetical protein